MPIEKIIQQIEEESKGEIDRIIDESRNEAEEILSTAIKEGKEECEKMKEKMEREIDQMEKRITSTARREANRSIMEAKEEVIMDCFKLAKEKLSSINDKKYVTTIKSFIERGKKIIGKKCMIVSSRKKDVEIAKRMGIPTAKEEIKAIGGIIIRSMDGSISIDDTFDGILERKKESIRNLVARVLFERER
jgi:V/A-type H+-transporting ATPase subunit E